MKSLHEQLLLVGASVISESTLINLIGDTPAGSNLARYMHRVHKVADQADWRSAPTDLYNIDWEIFRSSSNNLLLLKGANGWAMIRPVKETFDTSYDIDPDYARDEEKRTVVYEYYWAYGDKQLSDKELTASEQDLESTRYKRYGTKQTNKNVYTKFPFVEKTPGIVKTRERDVKKIIDDLTNKLHKIEKVWIADRREDTSKWKDWRQDYLSKVLDKPAYKILSNVDRLKRAIDHGPAGYQGRAGREVVPPGASIEMAKIAQRARDRKQRLYGDATTGAEGWDNLVSATEDLKNIVARRVITGIRRKFRDNEDYNNVPLFNIMRWLIKNEADWTLFLDQDSLGAFKKRIMNPKNKQMQQNLNLIINQKNPNARSWFANLLADELIDQAVIKQNP